MNRCCMCHRRQATIFALVSNADQQAKAHVCIECFEITRDLLETNDAKIEQVSQQEYNDAVETCKQP